MKQALLLALLFSLVSNNSVFGQSNSNQKPDLIVTQGNDSIACEINEETDEFLKI